nr:hypothetical protein [Tanacetum cinerariifolium]
MVNTNALNRSIGFDNPVRGLCIKDGLDGTERGYQGRCLWVVHITLVNDADNEMFNVDDLGGEEVFVEGKNDSCYN